MASKEQKRTAWDLVGEEMDALDFAGFLAFRRGLPLDTKRGFDWARGWWRGWAMAYGEGVKACESDVTSPYVQFSGAWEAWAAGYNDEAVGLPPGGCREPEPQPVVEVEHTAQIFLFETLDESDKPQRMTLGEFLFHNDALDLEERGQIKHALAHGQSYKGGGGASGEFSLRLARGSKR